MRRIISILTLTILVHYGYSQQIPLGNMYNSNEYLINSAESAVDTVPVIFLSHRQQWVSVEGLPITNMINGHTHVSENSAVGFKLFNDQFGLINQYFGMASFARRFMVSPKSGFALGLSAGYYQNSIKLSKAVVEDENDQVLTSGSYSGSTFETSASFMAIIDHFKLGVSVPRLLEQKVSNKNALNDFVLKRHVMVYSRFHYDLSDRAYLEPSVLWKLYPNTGQSQFEGNLDLYIDDKYTVGAGYRDKEAIMIRAVVKPHKYLSIGYSYEFFTSGFTQFSNGSHEIRIGIFFNRKKKQTPPLTPVPPKPRYHFEALDNEDAILLHLSESQPQLSEDLKQLSDRDDFTLSTDAEERSYVVELKSDKEHLQSREFRFKTLNELRDFTLKLKKGDPTLKGDIEKIIDGTDLIRYEATHQYATLASQDDIILKINSKDPNLSSNLKDLTERDDVELKYSKEGYAIDIGDESDKRRFTFGTLEEMNEFTLKLKEKNPGVEDNLLTLIDKDPLLINYEDKTWKYVKLNPNEKILIKLRSRSAVLSADIRRLTDIHDDVELVLEDDKRTYSLVIGEDLERRKFKFTTLGQMNIFMRKLKFQDKTLKQKPILTIDKDSYLQTFEDQHFVYKRLKASHELMLEMAPENPSLTENLKSLMEDRTDMVVSMDKYGRYEVELTDEVLKERKKFKFDNLAAMNQFTMKLKSANPGVEDNLKTLTDDMGLHYEDKSYSKEELQTLRATLRFKIGTSILTSYSERLMKEKIAIVKDKPFKNLIIAGYTCNIGSDQLNKKLSKQRAQKIANYFIKEGIPADKIEVHGKGPEYPLAPNTTDENRRKNRRVEFEVYF